MAQQPDSAFLIKEIRKGNKNAFELVFKKYYSSLCVYAKKYSQNDKIAEEIVSRFFFTFYQKRETLNIETSLRSYLYRSVRNTALNYLRENARMTVGSEEESILKGITYSDSVHETLIGKELEETINKAIDNLPDQCKSIFVKSRFEGKKYKEIATELNISINTVETQMSRALQKLRKDLQEYMHILGLLLG